MAGETPVRVDQEAHELLKEQAESSGRTLRDLASEAIKVHTGRDLRDEVSEQVDRLEGLCDRLEEHTETLETLEAVPGKLSDELVRLGETEGALREQNRSYGENNKKLGQLVGALEEAFRQAIEQLRGDD